MRFILDTNVMLLLVIGMANEAWVEQHKNTRNRKFTVEHYTKLVDLIGSVNQLATTSNILTEVSNLLAQSDKPKVLEIRKTFGKLISLIDEIHIPSKIVIKDNIFLRYGLTDALILKLQRDQYHILSVDGPLCYACSEWGLLHTNLTPVFFE